MSSKSKGKAGKGHSSRSGDYPSRWSDWEYSEEHKCNVRYRLKSPGNYEFDYEGLQQSDVPRTSDSNLDPSPGQPYTSFDNYATSVDTLTQRLDQTSLGPAVSYQQQTAQPPSAAISQEVRTITTRDSTKAEEEFDSNYKVHRAWEFKWGKVFKILWSEPMGNGGSQSADDSVYSVRRGKHGEKFFEKVRRFVIIDPREGHCICLPIMSYTRQGVNKTGVHAKDHAIIYTEEPVWFAGERERGLVKKPIRVLPTGRKAARHKLSDESRLNYAKVYTVEYNVKVWFIGEIHPDSKHQLVADYNLVHPPMVTPRGTSSATIPEDEYGYEEGASFYQSQRTVTGYTAPVASYSASNYGNYPATSRYQQAGPSVSYSTDTYPVQTAPYSEVEVASYPATSYPAPGYEAPSDPFHGREGDGGPQNPYDRETHYD